jgi:rRNA maturation RNase YbeY
MGVLITNRQDHHSISPEKVRQTAQKLLDALKCPDSELSLVLTDDSEIAVLNKEYLNHEGATNVISFPMQEGDFSGINPQILGDVVISLDTALKEAEQAEMSMEERLNELLIHGILHLLGYDHEIKEDEDEMEEKSRELKEMLRKS